MNNRLTISSLSVGYKDNTLLNNINLDIEKNSLIGVIGKNGVGKSTLLKTLSGMLKPVNGSCLFNDSNIFDLSNSKRSTLLSIVLSKSANIYGITVKDFIGFGRYPYTNWLGSIDEKDISEIKNAIQLCQLSSLSTRQYHELSDGERQKVNIARAVAQNTSLIILDEPTAHLDVINKIEIIWLLKNLVDNFSKTIILSTHHIEYAMQVCNYIWLIDDGQLDVFTPEELINSGRLSELYDNEWLKFDKTSLSFKIK